MHSNYLRGLQQAVDRTLGIPTLARPRGAQYWASGTPPLLWNQDDRIVLAIQALLACLPSYFRAREEDSQLTLDKRADYIARNCYEFHAAASQYLDHCGVPHDLVLGDVLVGGDPRYQASVDGLLHAAAVPANVEATATGHCWLTLEDGTILDATLRASLSATAVRQAAWSLPDLIHVATWDPEQGAARMIPDLIESGAAPVEYVPMLIGVELARSVGGLPPL